MPSPSISTPIPAITKMTRGDDDLRRSRAVRTIAHPASNRRNPTSFMASVCSLPSTPLQPLRGRRVAWNRQELFVLSRTSSCLVGVGSSKAETNHIRASRRGRPIDFFYRAQTPLPGGTARRISHCLRVGAHACHRPGDSPRQAPLLLLEALFGQRFLISVTKSICLTTARRSTKFIMLVSRGKAIKN